MKADKIEDALNNIYMALACYMEDCISSPEFKQERRLLEKHFELIETKLIESCEELTS